MKKIMAFIIPMLSAFACTDATDRPFSVQEQAVMFGQPYAGERYAASAALYVRMTDAEYAAHAKTLPHGVHIPRYFACSANLIDETTVLTAAHCISPILRAKVFPYYKLVFETDTRKDYETFDKNKIFDIRYVYVHPDYGDLTLAHDLAVLKLKNPVPAHIATPIPVLPPEKAFSGKDIKDAGRRYPAVAVSYGYDHEQVMGVKNITNDHFSLYGYCNFPESEPDDICRFRTHEMLNNLNIDFDRRLPNEDVRVAPHGIVYANYGTGLCNGDSGGPLYVNIDGKDYLAGVTSYGDTLCYGYGVSVAPWPYLDSFIKRYVDGDICTNGVDDDQNGKIDCDDPKCDSHAHCDEIREICDNRHDDDKNGKIDCDDLACKDHAHCANLQTEICDNLIDDDKNGKSDCADRRCTDQSACFTGESCDNNLDDNYDGLTDCDDPKCTHHYLCVPASEICDNRVDDDKDGFADCADPDCEKITKCKGSRAEICDNAIDDNFDGKLDCADDGCKDFISCKAEICDNKADDNNNGKIDCDEASCVNHEYCRKSPEICNNRIDDDKNGKVDCDDHACKSNDLCRKFPEICNNRIDDDRNGKIDCADEACANNPACQKPVNPKESTSSCSVNHFRTSSNHALWLFLPTLLLVYRRRCGIVRESER